MIIAIAVIGFVSVRNGRGFQERLGHEGIVDPSCAWNFLEPDIVVDEKTLPIDS